MAARIPLVLVAGDVQQLNLQDTLANNLSESTSGLLILILAELRMLNLLKMTELGLEPGDAIALAEEIAASNEDIKGT